MSARPTLPLLRAISNATSDSLKADLTAGLTTAIMLVPQAMAYAMLAGLDPIVGLYASILPTAIYALFGTSPVLAVGPVAMDSLLVAGAVAPIAGDDPVKYAIYASALMGMVGLIQLGMGTARLGRLVKYLKAPMMTGFTAAAALIIASSQLKNALGIQIPRASNFIGQVQGVAAHIHEANPISLVLSVGAVVTLVLLKKYYRNFPRFLAVVVIGTVLVSTMGLDQLGVATVGEVPSGLPSFVFPSITTGDIGTLIPAALAIALVAMMEATAVAQTYARQQGHSVDTNQELLALGAANVGGSLFQGYAITGGFSRTAVNAQAGARSNLAGLITAVLVAVSVLFLTPLFFYLPKAVLAAIILAAVLGLIDLKELVRLGREERPCFVLAMITFFATLALGIVQGIGVGIVATFLIEAIAKPRGQEQLA